MDGGLRVAARPASGRVRHRQEAWAGSVLVASDTLALTVAGAVLGLSAGWVVAFTASSLLVLLSRGHQRPRINPSLTYEAGPLVACVLVTAVVLGALPLDGPTVSALLRAGLLGSVLLLAGRFGAYAFILRARQGGRLVEPTLVIGAGRVGVEVVRVLQSHPEYGLRPVGFLDSFEDQGLPVPILGPPEELDAVLEERGIRRVIIAFGATREPDMVAIVRSCDNAAVDIHVVPRFFELGFAAQGPDVDRIWDMSLLRLRRSALRPGAVRLKRSFDIAVAGSALLVLAPLYALLALAVKVSSAGPILFRQRRVGQDNRPIEVLKFRSMRLNDDSETTWSVACDTRVTAVGRMLRRTSLDEFPQLINIIRGDMSLVGPRPERPYFARRFAFEIHRYRDRHRVPVGLTGWAQVHGLRGDTSIDQRARFDNQYIENWSLWLDATILVRTLLQLARDTLRRSGDPAVVQALHSGAEPDRFESDLVLDLTTPSMADPSAVPEAVG